MKNVGKRKKTPLSDIEEKKTLCSVSSVPVSHKEHRILLASSTRKSKQFYSTKHVKASLLKKKGVMTTIMSFCWGSICVVHASFAVHQQIGGTMSHNVV